MRIVVCQQGKKPEIREIENDFHVMEKIVGGDLAIVQKQFLPGIAMLCNPAGKEQAENANAIVAVITGTVIFTTFNQNGHGPDFADLTDQQIKEIMEVVS